MIGAVTSYDMQEKKQPYYIAFPIIVLQINPLT